ncbi:piercer of microtubule wall 2 protein isoform X1 [Monodelphis domestica]|uniref:Piercer of microtubule wall 2 n=2 Tax=Monodelphis domestica TaxID=13616 RepID=A0A5F8GKW6_MONDO|nr:piercer of microtubule wall 2 protein isoform X1 [Monodelphis domestica]
MEKKITSIKKKLPPMKQPKPIDHPPCVNPGNPVFSCMLDPSSLQTSNTLSKPHMIMYKTTSENYGEMTPAAPFLPCGYFPKNGTFTSHLRLTGMFQNHYLNTALDRGRVIDFPNFQHTL